MLVLGGRALEVLERLELLPKPNLLHPSYTLNTALIEA
jgi:hypothetical protein